MNGSDDMIAREFAGLLRKNLMKDVLKDKTQLVLILLGMALQYNKKPQEVVDLFLAIYKEVSEFKEVE